MLSKRPGVLILIAGLLLTTCQPYTSERPNVLFISIDTLRSDHTSPYGYKHDTTPTLQRIAREGAQFKQAYSPTSTTGPTHATLFTGLYPISHGVIKNGLTFAPQQPTLAEQLQAHGYQTAAIVGSFVLHRQFGWKHGFEEYQDDFERATSTVKRKQFLKRTVEAGFDRRANEGTRPAIKWLRNHQENGHAPFFLFLHYFDPHTPYLPPAEFGSRFRPTGDLTQTHERIARYDGEIAYLDAALGRLMRFLDESGLRDNTLLVITADHGEGLMERGYFAHEFHIYEELVRVPLYSACPTPLPLTPSWNIRLAWWILCPPFWS